MGPIGACDWDCGRPPVVAGCRSGMAVQGGRMEEDGGEVEVRWKGHRPEGRRGQDAHCTAQHSTTQHARLHSAAKTR